MKIIKILLTYLELKQNKATVLFSYISIYGRLKGVVVMAGVVGCCGFGVIFDVF